MEKQGSITVFLALILGLMLSLVCMCLQSVKMAAARTQVLSGVDIGLYSLFGQYDKTLLKDYDLFAIDGAMGADSLNPGAMYDSFRKYMEPVLKQNSQKLSLQQGGLTGYRLLTDAQGEIFYQQAVRYMKDTLGSHGAQLLIGKMRERQEKTQEAQQTGEQSENRGSMQSYEEEMRTAAQNSEAAREAMEKDESGVVEVVPPPQPQTPVENPIPVIRRIRNMSILDLVVPADRGVSDGSIDRGVLLSGREQQQGMQMASGISPDTSYLSQVLFQQYLMEKLGNYASPSQGPLQYETEYVLCGKYSDRENLKAVLKRLLLIREGVNFAGLMADPVKRAQAEGLSLAIASTFLVPPAAFVIESALLLCWSFAESILDVRELLDGGKVGLMKNAENWQLSLENLPHILQGLDTVRKSDASGLSYEDYLQVLLLAQNKQKKLSGAMDMIEKSVQRKKGKEHFRLDCSVVALEVSVRVRANGRKTLQTVRQYSYG